MKCPNKVNMFIWRMVHNSLPLRSNNSRRNIELDTRCPLCHRFDEDGGHLFIKCKYSKSCWGELLMEDIRLTLEQCISPKEIMLKIWQLPVDTQIKVVTILWPWVLWNTQWSECR